EVAGPGRADRGHAARGGAPRSRAAARRSGRAREDGAGHGEPRGRRGRGPGAAGRARGRRVPRGGVAGRVMAAGRLRWILLGGVLTLSALLVWGAFVPAPHNGGDNAAYLSVAH